MNGELVVVDDVPGAFASRVIEAFATRPGESFALALSGGATARQCYERLATDGAQRIDWWAVDVYWGDERCVPPDSPDSNQRLVRDALLERVGAANAVYPMRCEEGPDPYQLRVGEVGRFDVTHLGLGPDGHTASLFPGSSALGRRPGASRLPELRPELAQSPPPDDPHPLGHRPLTAGAVHGVRRVQAGGAPGGGRRCRPAGGAVSAERVVWLVDREAAPDSVR